jgi:site-specific recombinase
LDGDGMSDWQNSVEKRLDQLHGDTRSLLWAMIGGFVLTWSGLIAGFLLLSDKIDRYFLQVVDKIPA